jgi:hypothetical protein
VLALSQNGFSGSVSLSATNLPKGVKAVISPNPVSVVYYGESTLTLFADGTATPGQSTITVNGVSGALSATTTVQITVAVPTFTLSTSSSVTMGQGSSTTTYVTVGAQSGFAGSVTMSVAGLPAGVTGIWSNNPATSSANLAISASSTAVPGQYPLTFTGVYGSQIVTTTSTLIVVVPSFTLYTNSATLGIGSSTSNYVSVESQYGFSGSVTFSVSGLPAGVSGSFSPVSSTYSTSLGLVASSSAVAGAYTSPRYSVVADFNGDGYPDLAVTNTGGTSVSILLNNRGTFTVGASLLVTSAPTSIATGDFNGDGKADIAVTLASLNSIAVFLGNGDGTFSSPVLYSTSPGPGNLVVGDYNRDGNMDLAIVTSNGLLSLLLGNGNGTFTLSNISPSVSYYAQGIAQADLNGDGILDLVISSSSYEDLQVLLGNGDGTFSALTAMNSVNGPGQVVVADFNQDGVPDLAVASNFGTAVGVYLGNGDGTFAAAATPPFSGTIYAIAAADISGDGIPDLIAADIFGDRVITVTGKGDGTFASASIVSTGSNPEFVVAGDWNGDGVEDLAVPNLSGASATIVMSQLAQTVAATVSGISPDGTGPHKVVAVYSGDAAYASSTSAATTLTAIAGAPTVTVTLPSSSITAAQALSVAINVSGIPGDPVATGTVTLSSGSFLSAAVPLSSGGASMTIPAKTLTVGQDKITAVYTPDSSSTGTYTTASGSAMITITQASPTITWLPPSAIVYGTALGGTQLNVTSSVPGTFLYSPAAGAVLSAGNQTLSVIFTPTDGTTYVSETASVPLTVLPAPLTVTIGSTSRAFGAANPAFTGSISGYVNGDNGSVVSGSPILSTTAALNSPAGTYPITGSTGTLSAANYSFNLLPGTLTVLGGATQAITFQPIPNVPLGLGRLTLTAHSTSGGLGQPIVYSVTGPASISGSTLILTGAGTVTVTASEAGNATFAAAIPISQTFTVTP